MTSGNADRRLRHRLRHRLRGGLTAAVALLVVSCAAPGPRHVDRATVMAPLVHSLDSSMPDLTDMPGRNTSKLRPYLGRATVVEFGATNCLGCTQLAPQLDDLLSEYPRDAVQLVHVMDGRAAGLPHTLEFPGRHPVLHDEHGALFDHFEVSLLPTFAVVDHEGRVSWIQPTMRVELIEEWLTDATARAAAARGER